MMESSPAARRPEGLTEDAAWQALLARRRSPDDSAALAAAAIGAGGGGALRSLWSARRRAAHAPVRRRASGAEPRRPHRHAGGASRWLSGEADLLHTHRMRALADAVLVGAGTVRARRSAAHRAALQRRPSGARRDRCRAPARARAIASSATARRRPCCSRRRTARARASASARPRSLPLPRAEGGLAPQAIRRALAERGLGRSLHRGRRRHHLALSRGARARPAAAHHRAGAAGLGPAEPDRCRRSPSRSYGLRPRIRRVALGEDRHVRMHLRWLRRAPSGSPPPDAARSAATPLPRRAQAKSWCARSVSAVSRGTEALVFSGRVPPSQYRAMRCPFQEGDFPAPVKYGYAAVGMVEAGPRALVGPPRLLPSSAPGPLRRAGGMPCVRFPTACPMRARRSPPIWRPRSTACGTARRCPATALPWSARAWSAASSRRSRRSCRARA